MYTADELEASSRRHDPYGIIVRELHSGRFSLHVPQYPGIQYREPLIVEPPALLGAIRELTSLITQELLHYTPPKRAKRASAELDDLLDLL